MARRRLTLKRIDPWSVLKFGAIANVALLALFLLVMAVVWFIIDRLQVVDQICGIAMDVGFTQCGINAGNLFRAMILLGLLWVVVQTAVLVFAAFLHNLIADLTGGLVVTVYDEATGAAAAASPPAGGATATATSTSASRPAPSRTTGGTPRASGGDATGSRGGTGTMPPTQRSADPSATQRVENSRPRGAAEPSTGRSPADGSQPAQRRPLVGGDEDRLFGDR